MTSFESVRHELARARAAGAEFEPSWRDAVAQVADPDARWALAATREAWHAAYVGRPADRPLRALAALGSDPDREPMLHERLCEFCSGAIPNDRGVKARYCRDRCRRDANRARTIAA